MRYLPVAAITRRYGLVDQITEIGSGSIGITPYVRRRITGVDVGFPDGADTLVDPIVGSSLDIPFADRSRPCVLSVDMLEHIPPEDRAKAVEELVRVSGKLTVLAFPYGTAAELQDEELARYYLTTHGEPYHFLGEHVELGLPTQDEAREWVAAALTAQGRTAAVTFTPNSNLRVRRWLMRLWIRDSTINKVLWLLLNYAHPLFTRLNHGACYRLIVTIAYEN